MAVITAWISALVGVGQGLSRGVESVRQNLRVGLVGRVSSEGALGVEIGGEFNLRPPAGVRRSRACRQAGLLMAGDGGEGVGGILVGRSKEERPTLMWTG